MNYLWRTWIFCAICLYTTTFLSAETQSVAPYFMLTPANTTALLHTSIRLHCKAYGIPTPTIKWVKYTDSGGETAIQTGGRFIVGALFRYLYVLQIHWSDAGRYGCIAQNEHGRVETDAHISVVTDSAPSWDIKPHNVTIYEGQQYTLPCRAHGYPVPTYFWSHKGSIIVDLDVKVLSNNYLYFSNAKLRHSGWYTCTVSNFYGAISHTVYVDVVSDPSIVIHPEDVPIVRGGKITMSCGVVGSATVRVKWIQNDSNLPDDTLISFTNQTWRNVKVHTLNIKKARRRHLGIYHCLVQNAMGSVKSGTAKVYFSDNIPPLQIEVPKPIVTVSVGSDVELKCVFIGSPTPQVTWYKDGKQVIDIGTAVIRPINTRSEAILKLSSVTQLFSGHYVCMGDAGRAGTAKGNISLVVKGGSVPDITPLNQYKETKRDSNTTLQFFVMGTVEPDITWYKDGKQLENSGSTRLHDNGTYSVELQITSAQYSDSGLYTCTAENLFGTSSANVTLAVKGIPEPPVNVTVKHTSLNTVLVSWVPGYNGGANCTFSVQFKRSGATVWTSSDGILENATLSAVLSNKEGWNGQFVFRVTAVNQFGSCESSEVPVTLGDNAVPQERSDKDSPVGAIVGGVIGGVLAILLVIAVVLIMCRKKKRKGPPKPLPSVLYSVVEQEQYAYADPNANQSTQERCDTYSYVTVRPDATIAMAVGGNGEYTSIPRPQQWEVPKRNVRIDKKLGSGHFGMVMKGFLKTKQGTQVVAVKMLKENADQQQKKEFLAELELMKAMAPHPNIVGLVGCCTKSDCPFIIVEYCSLGNLMDFLRSSHGSVVYANMAGNSLTLTNRDLLSFAWQCARGMSYLASQKLVHRDLAARNVLVDTGNVCKIADFGLARDIYEKKQYLKKGEGELPLRWMAIESIFKGITTTESDVWSYGILLWEIVTLGANPYPGMDRDRLIDQLRNGYRMPKPQYCSDELYAIMWQCWQQDPESRPTFLELGKTLHRLMTAQKISIDLDNFDVSYINAPEEQ